jgi:response regulator RpfG family c-di-GMP phosphodiesterase
MHEMSGLDFKKKTDKVDHLRKKAIPFIVVSCATTKKQIAEAYDYRVQGFFMKPEAVQDQADMFDLIIKFWIISVKPDQTILPDLRSDHSLLA